MFPSRPLWPCGCPGGLLSSLQAQTWAGRLGGQEERAASAPPRQGSPVAALQPDPARCPSLYTLHTENALGIFKWLGEKHQKMNVS